MEMELKINGKYLNCFDIEVEGIDHRDAPDYSDAFISSASYIAESGEVVTLTADELGWVDDQDKLEAVGRWLHMW
jgi:hypothetical protein